MERAYNRNIETEKRTTLGELKMLLATNPDIFGNQLRDIRRVVEDAEQELEEHGKVSQGTAEELDNLYRPFKPGALK